MADDSETSTRPERRRRPAAAKKSAKAPAKAPAKKRKAAATRPAESEI
jgi:hypothetical protein